MIKLIITDMDGTVLRKDHQVSDYTTKVLIEAQKQGIKLCLASGRSIKTLDGFSKMFKMKEYDGYLVCANGVKIANVKTGEIEIISQLDIENIKEIMQFSLPYNVETMAVSDDEIYTYMSEELLNERKAYRDLHQLGDDMELTGGPFDYIFDQKKNGYQVHYIKSVDEIFKGSNKMCISQTPDIIHKLYLALNEKFNDQYSIVKTTPRWIEITPRGIDKGNALKKIMEIFDLKKEEVLVFGDGENDLAMLKTGIGVVMLNGMENIKEAIGNISEFDNDHDGVARYIEKYVLK